MAKSFIYCHWVFALLLPEDSSSKFKIINTQQTIKHANKQIPHNMACSYPKMGHIFCGN